jgi:hypothetical protein
MCTNQSNCFLLIDFDSWADMKLRARFACG